MGQKVNPHGARVGVIKDWSTKWYAGKKDFSDNLIEDYKLREMLKNKLYTAGISHIDIARTGAKLTVEPKAITAADIQAFMPICQCAM